MSSRIHLLTSTATSFQAGDYIALDNSAYTEAKKFPADKLPDPIGATDGYVWTADGADGAAWEAVSGGASDVTDLTTTTGSSTNMVRVAAAGGLEYRTVAQVLSDIGALAATGSVTGAISSAQTFTNGIVGPTWKPASDSTSALQLQKSAGTAVITVDTTNGRIGVNAAPDIYTLRLYEASIPRILLANATGSTQLYQVGTTGTIAGTNMSMEASSVFIFKSGGTETLRASAAQLIGIGTTNPLTRLHVVTDDATTSAVTNIATFGHDTTGTAAANFGAGIKMTLESSTTAGQDAARIVAQWQTATHASRAADLILYASDYGAEREGVRVRANGTAVAVGFLGATPAVRQTHIADPSGGGTQDAEARTAINSILSVLETFGLVATS